MNDILQQFKAGGRAFLSIRNNVLEMLPEIEHCVLSDLMTLLKTDLMTLLNLLEEYNVNDHKIFHAVIALYDKGRTDSISSGLTQTYFNSSNQSINSMEINPDNIIKDRSNNGTEWEYQEAIRATVTEIISKIPADYSTKNLKTLLDKMVEKRIAMPLLIYRQAIDAYQKERGDINPKNVTLDSIKEMLTGNSICLNEEIRETMLITFFKKAGTTEDLKALLDFLKNEGIQLTETEYVESIPHMKSCTALMLFNEWKNDSLINKKIHQAHYNKVMSICKEEEEFQSVFNLFDEINELNMGSLNTEQNKKQKVVTLNIVIFAYVKLGNLDHAIEMFNEMKQKRLNPDVITYGTLITGFCARGYFNTVFDLFSDFQKRYENRPDLPKEYRPSLELYNKVISACSGQDGFNKIYELFGQMNQDGIKLTAGSLKAAISARERAREKAHEKNMELNDVEILFDQGIEANFFIKEKLMPKDKQGEYILDLHTNIFQPWAMTSDRDRSVSPDMAPVILRRVFKSNFSTLNIITGFGTESKLKTAVTSFIDNELKNKFEWFNHDDNDGMVIVMSVDLLKQFDLSVYA